MIIKRTLLAAALLLPATMQAQTRADTTAVMRAGLDYIEGFYQGDADMLRRSVHPNVAKFGWYLPNKSTTWEPDSMSYAEFISYADRVKARGAKGAPPANAPKEVRILDLLDQTAALKVTAWWGTDYLHLAKYDGKWMILHVLWQSPPAK
ncbi:MAG TPA: nuclear transport factor 2 family protein [Longimicrobiales bacterium]|nr:nuclear transport factor 2 family protein [Longimicrobiales bacterium]